MRAWPTFWSSTCNSVTRVFTFPVLEHTEDRYNLNFGRMLLARFARIVAFALIAAGICYSPHAQAQAALLLEQPYGVYGLLNPTGHNAVYFQRVCAETPVKLRRCRPGEMGSVISRYEGIDGYDWV